MCRPPSLIAGSNNIYWRQSEMKLEVRLLDMYFSISCQLCPYSGTLTPRYTRINFCTRGDNSRPIL